MKGGTSELFKYLSLHPEILPSVVKETHFFDRKYRYGEYFYRSFFPLRNAAKGKVVLEATPKYVFTRKVPGRMRHVVPNVKLIAVLREPARRALSQYWHMVNKGRETRSFSQAIEENFRQIEAYGSRFGEGGVYEEYFTYIERGIYAPQIKEFLRVFGKNLLVLKSEELFENPDKVLNRVVSFIGASQHQFSLRAAPGKRYSEPDGSTLVHLRTFYEPYNQALYRTLGVEKWWQ